MARKNVLSKYEDFKGNKFLVVDDFPEFRTAIKRMVEAFGAEDVDTASNGEATVDLIAGKSYDAILCDYNIGDGKDGQQVLEESKYRGILKESQIFILLTAESTAEMVMGALEYEPDGYLVKPFNKEMVHTRLTKIAQKKRELREIHKAIEGKSVDEALKLCEEKIAEGGRIVLSCLKIKGRLLIDSERYDEAKELYTNLATAKKLPWVLMGLGQVHFLQENYDDAMDAFNKILEISAVNVEALDWIAKTHIKQGDKYAAQDSLQQAVELSSKAILRQQLLGDLAYDNEDFEAAEKAYREAVRLARYSCYRRPKEYLRLAELLLKRSLSGSDSGIAAKKAGSEAVTVLEQLNTLYSKEKDVVLQCTVHQAYTMMKADRADKGKVMAKRALDSVEAGKGKLEPEDYVLLGEALKLAGSAEKGEELIKKYGSSQSDEK